MVLNKLGNSIPQAGQHESIYWPSTNQCHKFQRPCSKQYMTEYIIYSNFSEIIVWAMTKLLPKQLKFLYHHELNSNVFKYNTENLKAIERQLWLPPIVSAIRAVSKSWSLGEGYGTKHNTKRAPRWQLGWVKCNNFWRNLILAGFFGLPALLSRQGKALGAIKSRRS